MSDFSSQGWTLEQMVEQSALSVQPWPPHKWPREQLEQVEQQGQQSRLTNCQKQQLQAPHVQQQSYRSKNKDFQLRSIQSWTTNHRWSSSGWRWFHWGRGKRWLSVLLCHRWCRCGRPGIWLQCQRSILKFFLTWIIFILKTTIC